jgi:hypothetical protein
MPNMPVITTYRSKKTLASDNAAVCAKMAELINDIPAGLGQGVNSLIDVYTVAGKIYVHTEDAIQDVSLLDYYDIEKVSA